jgi:hypothetical protein
MMKRRMKTMAIIYKNQKAREDESSTTAAAKAELNDLKAKAKQSINQITPVRFFRCPETTIQIGMLQCNRPSAASMREYLYL